MHVPTERLLNFSGLRWAFHFSLPVQTKMEAFISDATGGSELSDHTPGDHIWKGYHFKGKLADEGYNLTGFSTRGFIQFQDKENPLDTG